ncbi:MAG TPA: prepilin-type N-terminal cleavage/methylation domain-containing protein [Alphaproteobacteria bacterium]|nr:prepilin-type N-terminal cleavage/methylation domain-containing protein [Alphaproteobacteria bacterium]
MSYAKNSIEPSRESRLRRGFSVIELLVVIAIILVIAAISIPPLMHARARANEASAIISMKAVNSAQAIYANSYPALGYSVNLANLGRNGSNCETITSTNLCMLDDALTSGLKNGYIFELSGDGNRPVMDYTLKVLPEVSHSAFAGRCAFMSDRSGTITIVKTDGSGRYTMNNETTCE